MLTLPQNLNFVFRGEIRVGLGDATLTQIVIFFFRGEIRVDFFYLKKMIFAIKNTVSLISDLSNLSN